MRLLRAIVVFAAALPAPAQGQGLRCTANASPLGVRAEGLTELVGDIVLGCTGVTQGATLTLSYRLNVPVGNTVYGSGATDALLTVGEPAPGSTTPGVNVFQGTARGRNEIVWMGVPIAAPGSQTRVIRITNVRAAPALLSSGQTSILAALSTNAGSFTVGVGNIFPGLAHLADNPTAGTQVVGARVLDQRQDLNSPLSGRASPTFQMRFREGYAASFKTAAEEGGPAAAAAATAGAIAEINGTRLAAVFDGVPTGVRIYVRPPPELTPLESCSGSTPTSADGNGIILVNLTNGRGTQCFEVTRADPTRTESALVDVMLSYSNLGPAPITPGIINVLMFLAPTAFTPPGEHDDDLPYPVFLIPPSFTNNRHTYAAVRLVNPASGATDQIQLSRASGFSTGTFEGEFTTNIFLHSTIGARAITTTPILGDFNGAEAVSEGSTRPATAGWLTILPSQSGTPQTVAVRANPAGLAPGTYNAGIRIDSPGPPALANQIPVRLIVPPAGGPRITAIAGAADYAIGAVTAGLAIVVFGSGFGPRELATLTLDDQGRAATALGETRVLFDGLAAPLIYAIDGQVSALVPFARATQTNTVTQVRVEYRGVLSPPVSLRVLASKPALFTADSSGAGPGAILNQDGSVNTDGNAADAGSFVVLFGTGGGQTNPGGVDGRLAGLPLPALTQEVTVEIDGQPAEVAYAGPAPGLLEGVLQVNARIPAGSRKGRVPVRVRAGAFRSQPGVTVAVQ